jgi:hypothetical protein
VNSHSAIVHWLHPKQRGREALPATLRYVALSRFPEDEETWPDGAWSIEVRFDQPPPEQANGHIVEGQIRFLFDHAPQERLYRGARFSLYEGPQKVAEVEVLD